MDRIVFHKSEPELSWRDKSVFLEFFPVMDSFVTQFPNILKQVRSLLQLEEETVHPGKSASHLDEQHIPIYTEDTYKEFHLFFVKLLIILKDSLLKLENPVDSTNFQEHVDFIMLVGTVLQRLAKGNILKIHLETIESSLEDHRRVETIPASMPKLNEGFNGDEQDEDLEALHGDKSDSIPQALHVSYSEWLKLMLVYFDAIDVLEQFIGGSRFPFKTIDITILVSPRTSTILLPWKDIFNSKFLSNLTLVEPTSDSLLLYFQKAATSNISNSYSLLIQAQNTLKSTEMGVRKMKKVESFLNKLNDSTVPGWKEWAKGQLAVLNNIKNLKSSATVNLDSIADAIQLLLDGNQFKFFKFLNDIDSGKKPFEFGGTMHCEASLASLLVHSKVGKIDGYEDIRTQLKVG